MKVLTYVLALFLLISLFFNGKQYYDYRADKKNYEKVITLYADIIDSLNEILPIHDTIPGKPIIIRKYIKPVQPDVVIPSNNVKCDSIRYYGDTLDFEEGCVKSFMKVCGKLEDISYDIEITPKEIIKKIPEIQYVDKIITNDICRSSIYINGGIPIRSKELIGASIGITYCNDKLGIGVERIITNQKPIDQIKVYYKLFKFNK